jgi:hypothetical protein
MTVCVECLIGKQKKPILFKVTKPSSIPYRTHSACAKRAADLDPPPVIPVPESIAAQAAYQLRYKNTVCVECLIGKQKKPILFQVTEPSSIPYRTHSACARRAAYRVC